MSGRISSFGGTFERGYQLESLQSQLNVLTQEVSSGQKANPTASLGTSAALLYQLHAQSDQEAVLQTSVTTASSRLDSVQTALSSINSIAQEMSTQALSTASPGSTSDTTLTVLGSQAQGAMGQILGELNTSFAGAPVFAGDNGSLPMRAAGDPGGPLATVQATLSAAVTAKGGPLSASDVNNLLNGTDGLSSIFDDTNSNPAMRYSGAFYAVPDDGKAISVQIGSSQTLQYNASANQQGFRDLMKGLSMLSLLNAPSSQLDDTAKSELLNQAVGFISGGQQQLTGLQGSLGAVQSRMQSAVSLQQSAAAATQQQILNYEQADMSTDAAKLTSLQTQIQATYELTAQISQLSMVHYMPAGG